MTAVSRLISSCVLAGLLTPAAVTATQAKDAPVPAAVSWLMSDPMSMLDWGLYRADKNANEAASELRDHETKGAKWSDQPENNGKDYLQSSDNIDSAVPIHEIGYDFAFGYAQYDFDKGIIEIGFRVDTDHGPMWWGDTRTSKQMVTADACISLLDDARNAVFFKVGRETRSQASFYPSAALYAVSIWFSHNGYQPTNQPPKLYSDLLT